MSQQSQAIHTFVLGNKEFDDKNSEFQYDKGWYSITDIIGEEKNVIYKSKNAQEAYMKWNVYIGRKKERPVPEEKKNQNQEKPKEHNNKDTRDKQSQPKPKAKDNNANNGHNGNNSKKEFGNRNRQRRDKKRQ